MTDSTKCRALLLFGMPGSGKGTQGKAIGCMPGYLHVASGDIFRSLDRSSEIGQELSRYTDAGQLVPDELTIRIWREHMHNLQSRGQYDPPAHVLLLDGIPRTYQQAEFLANDVDVLGIFYLKLESEREAIERIKGRALHENRVDDADESVIRDRLRVFENETAATLKFYDRSLIVEINASQRPMQVLRDLSAQICQSPAEIVAN